MKNVIINFSFAMALLSSCSPVTEKNANKTNVVATTVDAATTPNSVKNPIAEIDLPTDLSTLIPIDLLDSTSTNVYVKYGIEFSGNCYACDLASLSITKNNMIWTNVCDEKDTFEIDNFSASVEGNKTTLKTSERMYILTKIDKAPVYELLIEGQNLELKNKRIAKYFTIKKALPLFKEHDCGDFEG